MKIKSEKYRELLEEERRLRNKLMHCETAQYRMLKKAFNGLGLKIGDFGDVIFDQSHVGIIRNSEWSVEYYRCIENHIETCEISFEDLFDAEVK
jgi:hypothetical protein